MSTSDKKQAASIVWFEIPADNLQRAREFYGNLFGWKINPFPGAEDYLHIDTAGADATPDGALKKRASQRRSRNWAAKSPCRKLPSRRWAISPFAKTPRATRLVSGRVTKTQNNCPTNARLFVVSLKHPTNYQLKRFYEHTKWKRTHAAIQQQ
jgi:Bleomycin resistance protein-like N-terminal